MLLHVVARFLRWDPMSLGSKHVFRLRWDPARRNVYVYIYIYSIIYICLYTYIYIYIYTHIGVPMFGFQGSPSFPRAREAPAGPGVRVGYSGPCGSLEERPTADSLLASPLPLQLEPPNATFCF